MKNSKYLFLFLCTLFVHNTVLANEIYYVQGGTPNGTGSGDNWANATALADGNALRDAINGANSDDIIYIGVPGDAAYTFAPDSSFPLKAGVKVFGGYYNVLNSDEPPRDFSKTILSGVNVITASGDITGALYDGFKVTKSTNGTTARALLIQNASTSEQDQPIFRNLIISDCVGGLGGAIGITGSGILTGENQGTIPNPVYVETDNKPIIFENLTLTNNSSSVTAGPVYILNSNVKFINLTATGNKCTVGAGGVIYATGSAIEINMGYFERNSASTTGGAVSTVHTPAATEKPYFTYLTFTNVTAKNNTSLTGGGAFFIASAQSERAIITFKDMFLSENKSNSGGGIYLSSVTDCKMENVYVEKNEATSVGGGGGGIYTTGYTEGSSYPLITYKNVTVRNNKSNAYGGGIYNTSMDFILEDFCIENNCARLSGGGLFNTTTTGEIAKGVNGRVKNNISGFLGGGMHFTTCHGANLTNVEIAGNYASSDGGGVYFTTAHQQVFKNCLIADNYSGRNGGGIYVETAYLNTYNRIREYINTTIANNYAKNLGGGIFYAVSATELTFKNSIVSNNTISTGLSSDFHLTTSAYISHAYYSLIGSYDNPAQDARMVLDSYSTDLRNEDPMFLRPADMQAISGANANTTDCVINYGATSSGDDFVLGNYRQTEGSPIIDAGYNDYSTDLLQDMDGRARVQGAAIDLGPYEGTGGEPYFECYEYCFPVMVWLGRSVDWQDASNWYPTGIPADCSDVYIPGTSVLGLADNDYKFPLLDGVQAANVCNRIFFMPGAQLGRPDLLTYNQAHVQINYSGKSSTTTGDWTPIDYRDLVYKGGGHREQAENLITSQDWINFGADNTRVVLNRGRWNMLSAPLKEMYTGDFAFGGFPFSFIKKYDPDGTSESYIKGRWANYDSETDWEFQPGQGFGHFYYPYLASGTPYGMDSSSDTQWNAAATAANLTSPKPDHLVVSGVDFGLSKTAGILHFPYFFDGSSDEWDGLSKPHRAHEYIRNDVDLVVPGTSTFHFYYEDPLTSVKFLQPANRSESFDRTGDAFRFIAEGEDGDMSFGYNPDTGFTAENNIVLLGNPYMGALDFDAFYENNTNEIKATYEIYNGTDGTYFPYTGDGSADRYIAPMQSFLVELTENAISSAQSGNLLLEFNPEIAGVSTTTTLRSSSLLVDRLTISASNPHGETTAWLRRSEDARDNFCDRDFSKIIDNATDRPEVYTLVNRENGKARALLMNSVKSDDIIVPIGFLSTYKGENTLCVEGMNDYQANVFFVDAKEKKEIDITKKATFSYAFTPDSETGNPAIENRFSLHFTPLHTTGIRENAPEPKIVAYLSGANLIVNSSTQDIIRSISVYDMQGQCIAGQNSISASSYQMTNLLQTTGVYVVRVYTGQGAKSIKVIKK